MVISFNKFERFEQPQIILCSPGSRYINNDITLPVGELSHITDVEIQFNFGSPSEMNFRLSYVPHEDQAIDEFIRSLFDSTANRMSLFLPDIGYFQITNTDSDTNGKYQYKDITAKSCDYELARKNIPYIEDGVYPLVSADQDAPGIMDKLLTVAPFWTIKYIDDDLSDLNRSFTDVPTDKDLLSFLTEDVQKAFECVIIFDIITREISIYAKANYYNPTDVHLSMDDLVTEVSIVEDADNIYTAMRVSTSDDITMGMVNPLGGNVVYDFHYFLSWMSPSLRLKMVAWEENMQTATSSYQTLCVSYYTLIDEQSDLIAEIERLDVLLDVYQTCKRNFEDGMEDIPIALYNSEIIAAGGEQITVYSDVTQTIAALQDQIDDTAADKADVESDLQDVEDEMSDVEDDMQDIRDSVNFKLILTADEYAELSCYVFEGNYTDEYIAITESMDTAEIVEQKVALYNRALSKLHEISEPTREFEISTIDFVFVKAFEQITGQLFTGCLVSVELSSTEVETLFLTGITVNYEERSAQFSFGNRIYRNDTKALFDEVLGEVSLSANTVL